MDFSFSEFCKEFSGGIVEALEEDGFDNLPALLSADRHDTEGLKLKKGHVAVVREAIKTLQLQHGEGPLRTPVSTGRGDMAGPDLARLWGLSPSRRKGHRHNNALQVGATRSSTLCRHPYLLRKRLHWGAR